MAGCEDGRQFGVAGDTGLPRHSLGQQRLVDGVLELALRGSPRHQQQGSRRRMDRVHYALLPRERHAAGVSLVRSFVRSFVFSFVCREEGGSFRIFESRQMRKEDRKTERKKEAKVCAKQADTRPDCLTDN